MHDDHVLAIPLLHIRMGLTETVDMETFFTKSMGANYGFAGGAVKYAYFHAKESAWNAGGRFSYSAIFGVDDFTFHQTALDTTLSYDIWYFRPYIGGGISTTLLTPTTSKVNLQSEFIVSPIGIAGMQFVWAHVSLPTGGR